MAFEGNKTLNRLNKADGIQELMKPTKMFSLACVFPLLEFAQVETLIVILVGGLYNCTHR